MSNLSSKKEITPTGRELSLEDYEKLSDRYLNLQDRYTALFKLNQLSLDCADLNSFFAQTHQVINSLMLAENFYIVMYDQTFSTLEFVYHRDENDDSPLGVFDYNDFDGSLTHLVIESGEPLLVSPELMAQLFEQKKITGVGKMGTEWLGVPLLNGDYVIGVMAVQSYSEDEHYTASDKDLLTFASQHMVSAIMRLQDRERLQKAVDARTRELMQQIRDREKSELLQESLYRISELTNDITGDIKEFYAQVHNIIGQLINASNFFIAKLDHDIDVISFVYYQDQETKNLESDFQPRKLNKGFTELVLNQNQTVLLHNSDMQDLHNSGQVSYYRKNMASWLGVPLRLGEQVLGAMVVQSYDESIKYSQQDAELLNFVANHVSSAIQRRETIDNKRVAHDLLEKQVKIRTLALEEEIRQRKSAEEQLKHTATHDSLTGLPNRSVFVDLLNHAIACRKRRPNQQFAILFLDLDRFKMVNDSLGHHAGDLLLQMVASELNNIVRGKDTVARLGGDEFVILIEDLDSKEEAYDVAKRITDFLKKPFVIEGQTVFIGTSIGLLFSDERYESADNMLRDADTAMYHAKDSGKGRYEVFDSSMQQKVQDALALELDIREAIELKEFEPYFQPIIRLSDNKTMGFEALARWQSHKRGFVFPNDFIPLAEETGLVLSVDLQILEKSCQQLKSIEKSLNLDNLYISCNMFCDHFFNPTFPDEIKKIIERVGIRPQQVRIELVERALLENNEIVLTNMQVLKQYGVKILLDDFGTGYSSLSYLHRFPIDVLKIDRSFIKNVQEDDSHKAIIKTIVDLATNLQMATVGEGIESDGDALFLKQLDCKYGQGFHFAKPMAGDKLENYLS